METIEGRIGMNYEINECVYAESYALDSALRFIRRQPWVRTDHIRQTVTNQGLDPDLVELMVSVLFSPAVVYMATGKSV